MRSDISDELRSECDVRNEQTVHYIQMNPVCSAVLDIRKSTPDVREIRGQYRRGNYDASFHTKDSITYMKVNKAKVKLFKQISLTFYKYYNL